MDPFARRENEVYQGSLHLFKRLFNQAQRQAWADMPTIED